MENYEFKKMSGELALQVLEGALFYLSGISPEHLTTFEFTLLQKIAVNPPKVKASAEFKILKD